jgi:signal peptidase II
VLFGVVAAVVAIADQVTKAWIDANFAEGVPTEIVGDLIRITKHYNDGGIFGLFGDSALILGIASFAVIAMIFIYQAREGTTSGPLLSLALGLLLGGAIGNLVDRLRHHYVIDFVDMGLGNVRWYTFNVADAAISISIVILIGLSLFGDRLPGAGLRR